MPRKKQLTFLPPPRLEHGGDIRKNKRKERRPFNSKQTLHIVMRSTRAKGEWSLLRPIHKAKIYSLYSQTASKCGVRVYRFANVGNHLHFLVKATSRRGLQRFLRILSGTIAMTVTGACKGNPVGRFWDKLVYSRVVSWGKEFETLKSYLAKNLLEGMGFSRAILNGLKTGLHPLHTAGAMPTGPP